MCVNILKQRGRYKKNPFPVAHKRPGVPTKEVVKPPSYQAVCQHFITKR